MTIEKAIQATMTATRRAEVEALARDCYVAKMADYLLAQSSDGYAMSDEMVAEWSFDSAEAWLAERDRRRGAE